MTHAADLENIVTVISIKKSVRLETVTGLPETTQLVDKQQTQDLSLAHRSPSF